jgi:enolase
MVKITELKARLVFDSRGIPTVEADVVLEDKSFGSFITPSGASTGKKEALELRDHEKQFLGRGVNQAISHIYNDITNAVVGKSFANQQVLDSKLIELDGTENKSRLGANAILSVSGAFFHALAKHEKRAAYDQGQKQFVLPRPMVNVINGGAHANNGLDIQEFMLVPVGADSFKEAICMVAEVFYALKAQLKAKGFSTAVGDEGGFAPKLSSNEQALDFLCEAALESGLKNHMSFALDVAANEMYESQKYRLNGHHLDREELLGWYQKIISQYPICSIEDPFFEEDFVGFSQMVNRFGSQIQVIGDDLFVTNEKYLMTGIKEHLANGILLKMNQVGTVSETIATANLAKEHGFKTIVSHRSGDSEDTTIADFAVLISAGQIKTGSLSRSERVSKYNRLLRIEEELGNKAKLWQP